jgi:hypothetical protein
LFASLTYVRRISGSFFGEARKNEPPFPLLRAK